MAAFYWSCRTRGFPEVNLAGNWNLTGPLVGARRTCDGDVRGGDKVAECPFASADQYSGIDPFNVTRKVSVNFFSASRCIGIAGLNGEFRWPLSGAKLESMKGEKMKERKFQFGRYHTYLSSLCSVGKDECSIFLRRVTRSSKNSPRIFKGSISYSEGGLKLDRNVGLIAKWCP